MFSYFFFRYLFLFLIFQKRNSECFLLKDLCVKDVDRVAFVIKDNLMFKILLKLKTVEKYFLLEKMCFLSFISWYTFETY